MTEIKKFPITEELKYVEDIDDEIFIPVLDTIENGLGMMGYKISDELSDEIYDYVEKLIYEKMFPNTDWRNYN